MHFSAIASVTIIGLSTLISAQPLDKTILRRQEPVKRPTCGWIDNIIDRACEDEEDTSSKKSSPRPYTSTPNQAQQPRPQTGSASPWSSSSTGGLYNPLGQSQPRPQQQGGTANPWASSPVGSSVYNPGQAPRPQAGQYPQQQQQQQQQGGQNQQGGQWQEAQSSPYENANGGESWCNRPDPARRPTYCTGPAAAPSRPQGQQGTRGNRGDRSGSG